MDLSIVDTFVRPDPAPYAVNRADEGPSSSNFSDILQERIATPSAGENRAEAATASPPKSAQPPANKSGRNAAAAESRPGTPEKANEPAGSERPATENEAADETQTPVDASKGDVAEGQVSKDAQILPVILIPGPVPVIVPTDAPIVAATLQVPVIPQDVELAADAAAPLATDALMAAAPKPVMPASAEPVIPATPQITTAPQAPAAEPVPAATATAPVVPADETLEQFAANLQQVVDGSKDKSATTQVVETPAAAVVVAATAAPLTAVAAKSDKPIDVKLADENAADGEASVAETDEIIVSTDGTRPASASRTAQNSLTPTSLAAPVSSETAKPLAPATGYATQMAAQESNDGQAQDASTDIADAKTAKIESKPVATVPMATVADIAPGTTQSSAATVLAQTETAALRTAHAASDTASAANAARTVAAHPIAEQIAVRMTKAVADSVDRIRIQLNPIELGHIDIRMEIGPDGRFNAVFAADRPQTVELLQRDARELARSLQDSGLQADMGSLSFNLRGDGKPGENAAHLAALNETRDPALDLAIDAMPLAAAGYGLSTTGNGRVDIRV